MPTVHSIGDTLLQLVAQVMLFVPKLVSAIILLIVGYVVAKVLKAALTKGLRAIKFDQMVDRAGVGKALKAAGTKLDAAAILASLVYWYVFLVFIELACNAMGLTEITAFVNQVLAYLPNVFVAIAILIVGSLLANVAAGLVRGTASEAGLSTGNMLSTVARWAILAFAIIAALTQLHVAESTITILFTAIVAAAALAAGLAFGLGGVDSARSLLASQSMSSVLQPGQRVQIGQQSGTVVRHDFSSTVLDTATGQVSIPNSSLTSEQVTVLGGGH